MRPDLTLESLAWGGAFCDTLSIHLRDALVRPSGPHRVLKATPTYATPSEQRDAKRDNGACNLF